MAEKPITLSKALQDYIAATGKTLPAIEREIFLKAGLMGGLGYLDRVAKGYSDDDLYSDTAHTDEGAKLLAAHLIAERKRLGHDVSAPPNAQSSPSAILPAPTLPRTDRSSPNRRAHSRPPRRRRSKEPKNE